jgi:Ty3 transposon capsid-like protein
MPPRTKPGHVDDPGQSSQVDQSRDTELPDPDPNAPVTITHAQLMELQRAVQEVQNLRSRLDASATKGFKVASPEPFDGKSTAQLRNFFSQLHLVFATQPLEFHDDKNKIMYAASFLRGTAFAWIQPYLEMVDPPVWMRDFSRFAAELNTAFGDPDISSANRRRIRELKQTGSVAAYTAEFRRLASQLTWDDPTLADQYFEGLKESVQDALIAAVYPNQLEPLIQMASRIDNLQRQRHAARAQPSESFVPVQRKKQPPHNAAQPQAAPSAWSPTHSSAPTTVNDPGPRPQERNVSRPRFQRLTDEQKEYRRKYNLCMYCGIAGHIAQMCPVRPENPARPPPPPAPGVAAAEPPGNARAQWQ